MLTDKQLKLIDLLVSGEYSILEACETVGIDRSTYYYWRKGEGKAGKEFNKAYDEALELKVKESRRFVKSRVNELLGSLIDVTESGKNENAKVNAVAKLLHYAELDPSDKQDITINNKDDQVNNLLAKWKEKKQDNKTEK